MIIVEILQEHLLPASAAILFAVQGLWPRTAFPVLAQQHPDLAIVDSSAAMIVIPVQRAAICVVRLLLLIAVQLWVVIVAHNCAARGVVVVEIAVALGLELLLLFFAGHYQLAARLEVGQVDSEYLRCFGLFVVVAVFGGRRRWLVIARGGRGRRDQQVAEGRGRKVVVCWHH